MTPEPPREHAMPRPSDEELFRDALRRTADALSLQPDLVPGAVLEGRRRRARNRALTVAGAFVAVTSVTLGLSVLGPRLAAGTGTVPAAPTLSLPAAVPSPSPSRTEPQPAMPSPTPTFPAPYRSGAAPTQTPGVPGTASPSPSTPSDPTTEEARRLVAGALDALLPASVGTVLPAGDDAQSYQARRGGAVHAVRLSVRSGRGGPDPSCRDVPRQELTCDVLPLADGTSAHVFRQPAGGRPGTQVSLRYRSGPYTVALSVTPSPSGAGAALSTGDLSRVARSPRFRELIAYVGTHPALRDGAAS